MKWSENKPPCILISGVDKKKLNNVLEKTNEKINENFLHFIRFFEVKYYKTRFILSLNIQKNFSKLLVLIVLIFL